MSSRLDVKPRHREAIERNHIVLLRNDPGS